MIENTALVATADGMMPVEFFRPDTKAPLPAVILFMDAPGIRDELHVAARRIARAGYVCALPDLYYRLGHIRIDLTRRSDAHVGLYRFLGSTINNAHIASDTASLLGHIGGHANVQEGPAACVGFSIGGRFAVQVSGLFPSQVAAVATVCATGLVTDADDSPHHSVAAATKTRFTLDFAENDPAMAVADINTLRTAFQDADIAADIMVHPETRHGYNFPMRPMYNPAAAEMSWTRALAALRNVFPME